MDLLQAKQLVIDAGHKLVECGLIARTWGNVSCRIDDSSFAITPSGRDYLSLTPDDIVVVRIDDCSYEGNIKPSSEKGVHAECYKLRPECGAVIHTHQTYASCLSVLGFDINDVPAKSASIIGSCVPVAAYGLPGTGKLRKGVADAVARTDSKAILMAHHGAVCLGADMDDAFAVANELEEVCLNAVFARYDFYVGAKADSFKSLADYIAEKFTAVPSERETYDAYNSYLEGDTIVMNKASGEGDTVRIELATGQSVCSGSDIPDTAVLHRAVYLKRDDVMDIIHSQSEAELAASRTGVYFRPLLDDFAQIVGVTMKCADYDPSNAERTAKKVVKKLRGRNAAFLRNNGVICVAGNKDDAEAVEMIADKACRTYISSKYFGGAKSINKLESTLMRVVYKLKYSKQTDKNK